VGGRREGEKTITYSNINARVAASCCCCCCCTNARHEIDLEDIDGINKQAPAVAFSAVKKTKNNFKICEEVKNFPFDKRAKLFDRTDKKWA
jgi:hypothetical protein